MNRQTLRGADPTTATERHLAAELCSVLNGLQRTGVSAERVGLKLAALLAAGGGDAPTRLHRMTDPLVTVVGAVESVAETMAENIDAASTLDRCLAEAAELNDRSRRLLDATISDIGRRSEDMTLAVLGNGEYATRIGGAS